MSWSGSQASGAAASAAVEAQQPGRKRISAGTLLGIVLAAAVLAGGFFLAGRLTARRPESPTFTRLTFQRGSIGNARFTPDGKSVLYSAAWDGGLPEVFETRTDLSTNPFPRPAGRFSAIRFPHGGSRR